MVEISHVSFIFLLSSSRASGVTSLVCFLLVFYSDVFVSFFLSSLFSDFSPVIFIDMEVTSNFWHNLSSSVFTTCFNIFDTSSVQTNC